MSLLDDIFHHNKGGDDPIKIENRGNEKRLKAGDTLYSKFKKDRLYTREYWDFFIPIAYMYDDPKVLLIGLGGGTMAYQLRTLLGARLDIDAVEISEEVANLSKEFIPNIDLNVIVGDGAEYVAGIGKRYDAIFLDAYLRKQIPTQFLDERFIDNAYNALSDDGILAINYAMGLLGFVKFKSYVTKLKDRFQVYRVNTAITETNVVILCSKSMGKQEMLSRIERNLPKSNENAFLFGNYESMRRL